jgi:hypothetical protein
VGRLLQWLQNLVPRFGSVTPLAIPATAVAIYVRTQATDPLRQSEILTDVVQRRQSLQSLDAEKPVLENISHPLAVVITQDCDLEQDFRARQSNPSNETAIEKKVSDKLLPNILLLEAISATELLGKVSGDIRKRVRQNKDERYHVLQEIPPEHDAQSNGLPALGVDFKRVFTIPTDELYVQLTSNAKRRTCLSSPYLEHLAKRFADFQSRVALPQDHQIK